MLSLVVLMSANVNLPQASEAKLKALGTERAKFGVPKTTQVEFLYNSVGEVSATVILFPEGRSDRRYMYGQISSGLEGKRFLSCQSKQRGKIVLEWYVHLVHNGDKKGSGTLSQFIAERKMGFSSDEVIPAGAMKALDAVKGFAAYKYQAQVGWLEYWFVRSSGLSGELERLDPDNIGDWPVSAIPYPISAEEKTFLGDKWQS